MIRASPVSGLAKTFQWLVVALLVVAGGRRSPAADTLQPVEFKAAIVAKVLPYVQWPKDAWPDATAPFVIGIFGGDPVQPILATLLKDQKLNGRDVVVQIIDAGTNALPRCQILFVPAAREAQWLALNKDANPPGLLTVGESEAFAKNSGVFNLLVEQQKLEISLKNAKKAGLEINSKLLKIAKVVR